MKPIEDECSSAPYMKVPSGRGRKADACHAQNTKNSSLTPDQDEGVLPGRLSSDSHAASCGTRTTSTPGERTITTLTVCRQTVQHSVHQQALRQRGLTAKSCLVGKRFPMAGSIGWDSSRVTAYSKRIPLDCPGHWKTLFENSPGGLAMEIEAVGLTVELVPA